jgi:hypothetical protein
VIEVGRARVRVTRLGEFSPVGQMFSSGTFFNCRRSLNFWATFCHGCVKLCKNFEINDLGYNLDIFFTNSSGHPGSGTNILLNKTQRPRKNWQRLTGRKIQQTYVVKFYKFEQIFRSVNRAWI